MIQHVLVFMAAALLLVPTARAEDAAVKPGLAVTYFGNPSFIHVAGTFETNSLNFQKDLGPMPWPAPNHDIKKGPMFSRDMGWSAMLTGRIAIPKAGRYRFAQRGSPAELWIGGRQAALDGKTTTTLPAGTAPLQLFVKSATPPIGWKMKVHLTWAYDETAAFGEIDSSLLSHTQADRDRKSAFVFDYPFEKGTTSIHNYRDFSFEAPEDGCYAFIAQYGNKLGNTILWLDGKQIYYFQPRGGQTEFGLEFRNNHRVTRYLEKGTHTVRLYAMGSVYPWDDLLDRVLSFCRFGAYRVTANDPEQTRSIVVKDRDDMVFRKGEPLVIRVEQATEAPATYEATVRKQRGDGAVLWKETVALKGGSARTAGEFSYPCDQGEGGFEIQVKDASGQVLAGPWAFVVVDATPRQLPTAAQGYQEKKILVDSIDCTLPEDKEHQFRDNGTSKIVESTVGKYRVVGDRGTFDTSYVKGTNGIWQQTQSGAPATAHFYGLDWFAYTFRVKNPGRPHLVVVEFPNDIRRLISVFAFDPVTGLPHTGLIEAGDAPASAPFGQARFVAWPNTNTLDVIAINSGTWGSSLNRQTAASRIELYELADGIPGNPAPAAGWDTDKEFGWTGEQMDLGMEQLTMPKVWEGNEMIPGNGAIWPTGYYDWEALFTAWDRCGQYAANRGANLLCWVVYDYGRTTLQNVPHSPKLHEGYSVGWKARQVDPFEREQFKMMLLLCEKYRLRFVIDFMMQRLNYAQILATDKEKKYDKEGIFVNDRYCFYLPNPAHPLAKQYVVDMMGEYGKQYGKYPAFAGVYTRQWGAALPQNLDCWYSSDLTGYDDFSIGVFEKETGIDVPKIEAESKKEALRDWILANCKEPWLSWRCRKALELREAMTAELQKYAPNARMYATSTPTREAGLDPEQVKGRRDLGYGNRGQFVSPHAHIEIARPDPIEFANFDVREPASLRRSLANLLPDTAFMFGGREYPYGFYAADNAIRVHPYQLKGLAEALAARRMETFFVSGTWMLPPMDEGLRLFAQAWRSIPELDYRRLGDNAMDGNPAADAMMVCWQAKDRTGETVFYLVNRTARKQLATVTLDDGVSRIADRVTGRMVGKGPEIRVEVDAYMPAVFESVGGGVRKVEIVTAADEVAALKKQVDHLRSLTPQTNGLVQILRGRGEKYVQVKHGIASDDREWGRRDLKLTFADLLEPIEAAWEQKNYAQVRDLLDTFLADHNWWYQALGWPDGEYNCRVPKGPFTQPAELLPAMKGEGLAIVELDGIPWGEAVQAPRGSATFAPTVAAAGKYDLLVWLVAPEAGGTIAVSVNGKPAGTLRLSGGKQRLIHCTLPQPVGLLAGKAEITFTSKTPLRFSAIELSPLPPEPIKVWSAVGIFDTGLPNFMGFTNSYAPETAIDLAAEYDGLGGKKIKWRQIDIGDDKFLQLLEKYYPYKHKVGNGLAYLATWIHSPTERDVTLYYASDWFLQIWLNGEDVVHYAAGPWQAYATQTVHLKAGWNTLLAKCMNGSTSWKAVFAVSDPGDLQYLATPYVPTVFKARRARGAIALDGALDEADWRNAADIGPFWGLATGKPALAQGTIKALWDDTHLYLAGDLKDSDLVAASTKHDAPFFIKEDAIEVFLMPTLKSTLYYETHLSPLNATYDAIYRFFGDWKDSEKYESGLETAVRIDGTLNNPADRDGGWTFEMRIPFAALEAAGRKAPTPGDRWAVLFSRYEHNRALPPGYQKQFQSSAPAAIPFELSSISKDVDRRGFHDHGFYQMLEFVDEK
ncbi:MAG: sugar-binding protein [Kiritimatiellae bacterium]|nr:sugar-binding protein [Kiritimatiellia bacterium]